MTTAVAIPESPTSAEDLAPGALSKHAADLVPVHRRQAALPDRQEWVMLAGIANTLAASEMLPKGLQGRPNNVLAVILKGRDLGLSPTESVWGIDMIEGMPSLKAHTMSALIKRAGHRLWYADSSRDQAVIVGQRLERYDRHGDPVYGPEVSITWTIQDAIDAKLVTRKQDGKLEAFSSQGNKPKPWMLYPAAMLRARALTALARMEFSDVLMGAWYSPEELGAEVDAEGKVLRLPRPGEAVAAFESLMERKPQHTADQGGDGQQAQEPEVAHSPQQDLRDGEDLSGMLNEPSPEVVDVEREPEPEPEPVSREALWAELVEHARVLAAGNLARHTARAVALYKANAEDWTDEQLAEFVTGRRESYDAHLAKHPEDLPAPATDTEQPAEPAPTEAQPADEPAPAGTEPDDGQHPAVEPVDEPTSEADATGDGDAATLL